LRGDGGDHLHHRVVVSAAPAFHAPGAHEAWLADHPAPVGPTKSYREAPPRTSGEGPRGIFRLPHGTFPGRAESKSAWLSYPPDGPSSPRGNSPTPASARRTSA